MLYKSVLENMQKADHTLRVCLGGTQYKKLKNLERRAMDMQKVLLEVRSFMEKNPTKQSVKDLKVMAPELNVGILSNHLNDDTQNLWAVVRPIQLKCQKYFKEIRQMLKVKPGAEELYQRMITYKSEYTRLHFNMNAPSHESILTGNAQYMQRTKSQVEEIDRLMAGSIYRNQKGITHAEFHQNNLELFSLDLIAQNYTAETSVNLPECEVLRMTPMWKYVGKGIEVIQVRVDELNELQNRFFEVDGVAEIIQQMATDRQAIGDNTGAEFVEEANGDMVATETFDDEYVEQITDITRNENGQLEIETVQRGVTECCSPVDISPFAGPRGVIAGVAMIDEASFLPKGDEPTLLNPELLSVVGLNAFGHTGGGGSRMHMFAGNLTDEQMREKLLASDSGTPDRDYLMTWSEGSAPPVGEPNPEAPQDES